MQPLQAVDTSKHSRLNAECVPPSNPLSNPHSFGDLVHLVPHAASVACLTARCFSCNWCVGLQT